MEEFVDDLYVSFKAMNLPTMPMTRRSVPGSAATTSFQPEVGVAALNPNFPDQAVLPCFVVVERIS
jgi:hypothetical protein